MRIHYFYYISYNGVYIVISNNFSFLIRYLDLSTLSVPFNNVSDKYVCYIDYFSN